MSIRYSLNNRVRLLLYLFIFSFSVPTSVWGAEAPWKETTPDKIPNRELRTDLPVSYRSFELDLSVLQSKLQQAPMEVPGQPFVSSLVISLPGPDGRSMDFKVRAYEMMEPGLSRKFPALRTYQAVSISDPSVTAVLDLTYLGFHAMVMDPAGWYFIDPFTVGDSLHYIVYFKRDARSGVPFECGSGTASQKLLPSNGSQVQRSAGTTLRTYRLAVGCTGEYAAFFGGTVPGAMSGIVTSVNRVNAVYEQEVAIRMILVTNNDRVVYTNAATDPYTNSSGSTMLGENQTTLDSRIGSANYDIGHVFSTGGGGVASLRSPCTSSKARGVTGRGSPTGDAFDIDYVAHEMGHQFGGNHTFNGNQGSCSGNRSASTAYEVGSGTTIMAYAGICGTDNTQSFSDPYFHTISFDEIRNFVETGSGSTCGVASASGNQAPSCNGGANYTIPISTPFTLTGSGTDPDGDRVTYLWEQFDLGAAGAPGNATSTTAPIFRCFVPASTPSRTFPKLSDILNNTTTIGEILPSVARTLKFRMTVRDNRFGGGGVTHHDDTIRVTVVNSGGAFSVTAPNTAVTWASGATETVTWNVSGTTGAPISCANVRILLSIDGGLNFNYTLNSSTANDGSESVTVPNLATTQARIKVEAVGNIFFDISNTNFTITAPAAVATSLQTNSLASASLCPGSTASIVFTGNGTFNAGNVFTVQLSNGSGSFSSPVTIGTLTATSPAAITVTIPLGTVSDTAYRIRVISSNPALIGANNGSNLTITALPAAAAAITGSVSVCQTQTGVVYTVPAVANAAYYQWTLPSGATFGTTTYTNSISVNYSAVAINGNVTVAGRNACGTGASSSLPVTVNTIAPAAGVITGTASVCAGTSGVTYSITPLSGVTGYSWSLPSGATIVSGNNTNSITVNFGTSASSGTISVAGVNSCGSGTASSLFVSVLPIPAAPTISAGGSTNICPSGSVNLSYTGTSGYDYQWRRNGADISGATSSSYSATQGGTYDVRTSFAAAAAQSITNATPATINDNTCSATGISNIVVSGYSAVLPSAGIAITINLTHTYDGDIAIFLQAPNGDILGLSNQLGGSGDNFTNTVFTDTASSALPASGAPYTGYYKPATSTFTSCITSNITSFGQIGGGAINPNGTWSLRVYDRAGGDVGTINSWTLHLPAQTNTCTSLSNSIIVTELPAVTVSGFSPTAGTAGTLVTISGTGFTGATAVTFNGTSASFTVVNSTTITATVPAGATTGVVAVTAPCGTASSGTAFTIGSSTTLNVHVLIEGYHLGGGVMPEVSATGVCDTVTVVLAAAASPGVDFATARAAINTSGWGAFVFSGLTPGSYYIGVRHRNSIETWSASAISLSAGSATYDFTTASTQAYGGNLRNLGGGRFALFSGDVNQDDLIESADYGAVENAVVGFLSGYQVEDLTGDNLVESTDYSLIENNLMGFIFSIRP